MVHGCNLPHHSPLSLSFLGMRNTHLDRQLWKLFWGTDAPCLLHPGSESGYTLLNLKLELPPTTHPASLQLWLLLLWIIKTFYQLQSFGASFWVLQRPDGGSGLSDAPFASSLGLTLCLAPLLSEVATDAALSLRPLQAWHHLPQRRLAFPYFVACSKHSIKSPFWRLGGNVPKY